MAEKKYDSKANQIFRADNRGKFVEVSNQSFGIDKVLFRFMAYDMNKASGSRATADISIYLDFSDIFYLHEEIVLTDKMALRLHKLKTDIRKRAAGLSEPEAKKLSYQERETLHMGGTSAARAKSRKYRPRTDGQAESRTLAIMLGDKSELTYMLIAQTGPGKEQGKGLIAPTGKVDASVMIALPKKAAIALITTAKAHIDAYLAGKYANNVYPINSPEMQAGRDDSMQYRSAATDAQGDESAWGGYVDQDAMQSEEYSEPAAPDTGYGGVAYPWAEGENATNGQKVASHKKHQEYVGEHGGFPV